MHISLFSVLSGRCTRKARETLSAASCENERVLMCHAPVLQHTLARPTAPAADSSLWHLLGADDALPEDVVDDGRVLLDHGEVDGWCLWRCVRGCCCCCCVAGWRGCGCGGGSGRGREARRDGVEDGGETASQRRRRASAMLSPASETPPCSHREQWGGGAQEERREDASARGERGGSGEHHGEDDCWRGLRSQGQRVPRETKEKPGLRVSGGEGCRGGRRIGTARGRRR